MGFNEVEENKIVKMKPLYILKRSKSEITVN
jgi:hypothetical protein